eukprot:UN03900
MHYIILHIVSNEYYYYVILLSINHCFSDLSILSCSVEYTTMKSYACSTLLYKCNIRCLITSLKIVYG